MLARASTETFDFCLTVHHQLGKVIKKNQLDATIALLIYAISSTCFGQSFAHHQEHETENFYSIWYPAKMDIQEIM
jgi:hypothetical protein